MNEKTIVQKSEKLLQTAKNIFGEEIVEAAYVTTWDYDTGDEEIKARLSLEQDKNVKRDEIDIDGRDVIILLKNGKAVSFSSSEWGEVKTINLAEETVEFGV